MTGQQHTYKQAFPPPNNDGTATHVQTGFCVNEEGNTYTLCSHGHEGNSSTLINVVFVVVVFHGDEKTVTHL